MKTKYDVGQEVGIKGRVERIVTDNGGTRYHVNIDGNLLIFKEDELSDIIDLSGIEG